MADDRVIIEIKAENDQLKAKLAESQAEIDKLKAKGIAADESGLGFRKSVSAVRQWIGSVTAAIGVATTFFVLGQKIRDVYDELFTSGAEKARKFSEALMTTEPTERLKKYSDEIDVLQSRLAASSESIGRRFLNIFSGNTTDALTERIAALEKRRAEAQNQLTAKRNADERKIAKTQEEELVAAALEVQRVVGLERAKRAYEDKVRREAEAKEGVEQLIEDYRGFVDEFDTAMREASERAAEAYIRIIKDGFDEVNRANAQAQQQQTQQANGNLIALRRVLQTIAAQMPSSPGNSGYVPGGGR